ncbi:MAG: CocE/NonD family hydrolase [Candidatus Brocadiae bacterium]|nr:CocE/NonD family hydrolase [Candidatus Brocadiia bacterium]
MRTLALLALLAVPVAAGDWRTEMKNVALPMRDGKSLAADIYLPAKEGTYPCVLIQTPYNKTLMGTVMTLANVPGGETGRGATSDMKVFMDRDNYAYVFVDWRGFYGSKAAMAGVRGTGFKRGLDGYDCVEWIAVQPWSNGKVGTWGGSALGKQQLDTAAEHPPHLVCCVPLIAAMGSEYEAYYEGGVLLEGHVERLDQLGFGVGDLVKAAPLPWQPVWTLAEKRTFRPGEIQVPCLMVTGWWDNYPDLIVKTFEGILAQGGEAARKGSRLLIGPWDHVRVGVAEQGDLTFEKASLESGRAAKAFLDFHLRGITDNGWDKTPRVRYWVVNEDGWKSCESWTALPRGTKSFPLPVPAAAPQTEPKETPTVTWTFDPVDPSPTLGGANLPPMAHGPTDHSALSGRKDGAWFRLGRGEEPLRINGHVELTLVFEANAPDCDFTARLCVAAPDGPPILLTETAARAKVRDGKQIQLLQPGVSATLTLRFPSIAATVPPGHELSVYLANTNWPRYERNTGTGADHWDEKAAQPVKVTIHAKGSEIRIPSAKE